MYTKSHTHIYTHIHAHTHTYSYSQTRTQKRIHTPTHKHILNAHIISFLIHTHSHTLLKTLYYVVIYKLTNLRRHDVYI